MLGAPCKRPPGKTEAAFFWRQQRLPDGASSILQLLRSAQAENEEPHPQVLVAFGLRITNWEPSSPSV